MFIGVIIKVNGEVNHKKIEEGSKEVSFIRLREYINLMYEKSDIDRYFVVDTLDLDVL